MKKCTIVFTICSLLFNVITFAQMTNEKMEQIIEKEVDNLKGETGNWTMEYGNTPVIIITDEKANRMRVFAPVIAQKDMKLGAMEKLLEANFHSALDAKYCLYDGVVISIFTHPLKELTEEQFIDAMRQVVILTTTYGTTYSSTDMIFGGGFEKKEKPKVKEGTTKT